MTTSTPLNLFDTIALTTPIPEHHLVAGQVGTIVEILAPEVYEIEFSDDDGQTYATQALPAHQLLKLHYKPMPNNNHENGKITVIEVEENLPVADILKLGDWQ